MDDLKTILDKQQLNNFFLNQNIEINFLNFFTAIFLSLILALLVKFAYKRVGRALNDKDYFSDTFIPLCMITTLVITVVKFWTTEIGNLFTRVMIILIILIKK